MSKVAENKIVERSNYISRDLSWLQFNIRVLEQAKKASRTILERLKFIAITASNLDEFMMIRVGSLYNYLDYDKSRVDYSGLREWPFKYRLFNEIQEFIKEQTNYFEEVLRPEFKKNGFEIKKYSELSPLQIRKVSYYFSKTIYPMLSPMLYDAFHPFPILMNKALTLGVVTKDVNDPTENKISFVHIPQNIPRYFTIEEGNQVLFIPIEEIVINNIEKLYKNIEIISVSLFRITRNGDFNYDDYDESEYDFVEEIQKKLKKRKTGRVVRLEIASNMSTEMLDLITKKYSIEEDNIFRINSIIDYTSLWQIIKNPKLSSLLPTLTAPVRPLFTEVNYRENIFEYLKDNDLLLHHPYNSMEVLVDLLEQSAVDPDVFAIKITIYRLADDSRISDALLKAAENGKHVSVLFEVKARFDEENNIQEGQRLQRAGCYVIYGVEKVKTHTKLMMIVRREKNNNVTRYVHMSSGNYNESTAKLYTDIGVITTDRFYAKDISEFFNVITGHSMPDQYHRLITTPGDMRKKLISFIRREIKNHKEGKKSGIVIKVNSMEDLGLIDELYKASKAGVKINLIIRGICCVRPGRKGVSENITVKSVVGDFLEHSRIYYFHNGGEPRIYGGSADCMVRSFDKRIESLYMVQGRMAQIFQTIIKYNLKDEENSFILQEDGTFVKVLKEGETGFNLHREFYNMTEEEVSSTTLEF